jgi:hypothetical protein
MSIKDHIKGVVKFQYYRDSKLFYKTETGVLFPVPVEDIGNATFLAEDKAMLFMRYIRKHLETISKVDVVAVDDIPADRAYLVTAEGDKVDLINLGTTKK